MENEFQYFKGIIEIVKAPGSTIKNKKELIRQYTESISGKPMNNKIINNFINKVERSTSLLNYHSSINNRQKNNMIKKFFEEPLPENEMNSVVLTITPAVEVILNPNSVFSINDKRQYIREFLGQSAPNGLVNHYMNKIKKSKILANYIHSHNKKALLKQFVKHEFFNNNESPLPEYNNMPNQNPNNSLILGIKPVIESILQPNNIISIDYKRQYIRDFLNQMGENSSNIIVNKFMNKIKNSRILANYIGANNQKALIKKFITTELINNMEENNMSPSGERK